MAKLTSKQRKAMPKSEFGVPSKAPGKGSFPINDKTHAEKALQFEKSAPPAARPRIETKAKKMLGKKAKAK